MSFLESLKRKSNLTQTENGALTYKSTESDCLDLFYQAGAMRNASKKDIASLVMRAYAENSVTAMKILFFARDIRGGLGERRFFRMAMEHLANCYPDSVRKNLMFVPEYGRWDDLLVFYNIPALHSDVVRIISRQLKEDTAAMNDGEAVSLLAKWLPSVNASSEETKALARRISKELGMQERNYRKKLSSLRKYIDIIENRLREKDYTFEYSAQPSRALLFYRNAFIRNDKERYFNFLNEVNCGKSKLNTSTLYPYDIVRQALKRNTSDERYSLDTSWKSLNDIDNAQNAIAVVDGSGSMYGNGGSPKPYEAALALGLYFAEHNKGAFANHFITFSMHPRLVEIKGRDITEKVKYAASFNECANTNLQAVFDLILDTAVTDRLPQSELPETIYIISDMEFDTCVYDSSKHITNFKAVERQFAAKGYKLPKVVFWNVASRNQQVPVKMHQSGAALVSGASPAIFDMVKEGEMNPFKLMNEIIGSERYDRITA